MKGGRAGNQCPASSDSHGAIEPQPAEVRMHTKYFLNKQDGYDCCASYFEDVAVSTGTTVSSACYSVHFFSAYCRGNFEGNILGPIVEVRCSCPGVQVCENIHGGDTASSSSAPPSYSAGTQIQCVDNKRLKFTQPVSLEKSDNELEEKVTMDIQKWRPGLSPIVEQFAEVSCLEDNPKTHRLYNGGETAGRRHRNTIELFDVTGGAEIGKLVANDQNHGYGAWARLHLKNVPQTFRCRIAGNFASTLVMSVVYFDTRRKIHELEDGEDKSSNFVKMTVGVEDDGKQGSPGHVKGYFVPTSSYIETLSHSDKSD